MSTYGKFEVIEFPSFFVVVNMQTHEWASKTTTNRAEAHRKARRLKRANAKKVRRK